MRISQKLLLSVLTLTLVACGGDNVNAIQTNASNEPIDKYVGKWIYGCRTFENGTSSYVRREIKKLSSDRLLQVVLYTGYYTLPNCAVNRDNPGLSSYMSTYTYGTTLGRQTSFGGAPGHEVLNHYSNGQVERGFMSVGYDILFLDALADGIGSDTEVGLTYQKSTIRVQ